MSRKIQLDFDSILMAYGESADAALYAKAAATAGITPEQMEHQEPVGTDGRMHATNKRTVRWHQQTLKRAGFLEKTDIRGKWRLTSAGRKKVELRKAVSDFSFDKVGGRHLGRQPCGLLPHRRPLLHGRGYGKWREEEILDLIISTLEPICERMEAGASLMLNVGNDVFEPGLPSRSMWVQRLSLRLHDALSLHYMDEIIWNNESKPPQPTKWACVEKIQLGSAYEKVLWFCNNPLKAQTDNTRILRPMSEGHAQLIARGGEKRHASNGDGSHVIKPGSFSGQVQGKMPRNVMRYGHSCARANRYRAVCKEAGLPTHQAMFPYAMARDLIEFGAPRGKLVVDPFSGSGNVAEAAEDTEHPYVVSEIVHEYLMGNALTFGERADTNPDFYGIYDYYARGGAACSAV